MNAALCRYVLLAAVLGSGIGLAAPGDLDTSFGTGGMARVSFGDGADHAFGLALQPDGKVVVVGYATIAGQRDFALTRFTADGTLDLSFAGTGKVTTAVASDNDEAKKVAVQADGKIIVCGYGKQVSGNSDFAVVRYNPDGGLDTTFGGTGRVLTPVRNSTDLVEDLEVLPDGKIVVVGRSFDGSKYDCAIVRYESNGGLDATFNSTGKAIVAFGTGDSYAYGVERQVDGKLVVVGRAFTQTDRDIALARLNIDGTLDASFGTNGLVTTPVGDGNDYAFDVTVRADGKILVAGYATSEGNEDWTMVRYLPNGVLDQSFGVSGKVVTPLSNGNDICYGMAVQPDERIVLAGLSSNGANNDIAAARYSANGVLDSTFNGSGFVTTPVVGIARDVAIQKDGRIVVAGYAFDGAVNEMLVLRYLASEAPLVAVGAAANLSGPGATLVGAVNPSGVATTVRFEYGTSTLYGSTTPVQTIPAGTSVVDVFAPIGGLVTGVTYNFRLVASNAGGEVKSGNMTFQAMAGGAGGATAMPTATTGNAVNVSARAATLEGMVTPNGGATQVRFEYGLTENYTFATPVQSIGNGTSVVPVSKDISGLEPGRTYHYRIVGSNGLGLGTGADRTFTTSFIAPSATTEAPTDIGVSFATLRGTVTPNDLPVAVSFELAETEAALLGAGVTVIPASPGNIGAIATAQAVTANVRDLPAGPGGTAKTYFYRTRATPVDGGASVFGSAVSFTVQNSSPVAVDDSFIIVGDAQLTPLANDRDADPADVLTIVAVNTPTAAQFVSNPPTISLNGQQITYEPSDIVPDDGDSFSYTIADSRGAQATATIRVFQVRVLSGTYSGLIGANGGGADSGRLDVTLTRTGQITGSFRWQGQLYPFKNAVLSDGRFSKTVAKFPGTPAPVLEISFTLNPATKTLTGTLTDTSTSPPTIAEGEITGTATIDDVASEDLPVPGIYAAYIEPNAPENGLAEGLAEAGVTVAPRGPGFAQITVAGSRSRPARTVGRMPDNQPFSSGARALVRALRAASGQVRYPLHVDNLYPKVRDTSGRVRSGGVVSGALAFTRNDERFDSDLNWERLANPTAIAPQFQGGIRGFIAVLNAIKYGQPAPGNLPGGIVNDDRLVNARIDLREGGLPLPITHALKVRRTGTGPVRVGVEPLNPRLNVEMVKLSMNAQNGKFSGSFLFPGTNKPTKFNGVFKKADGQGVFIGPETTGRVQIQRVGE